VKREEFLQNPEIAQSVASIATPEQTALAQMPLSIPAEHHGVVADLVGRVVRAERGKIVRTINTLAGQMDEALDNPLAGISAATLRGVSSAIDLLP
jgi:hypothetical protein